MRRLGPPPSWIWASLVKMDAPLTAEELLNTQGRCRLCKKHSAAVRKGGVTCPICPRCATRGARAIKSTGELLKHPKEPESSADDPKAVNKNI